MKLMLRSARALLAAAAAPRHVLVLLGADVDCPCRRHDHPRQNALVNYAGCRQVAIQAIRRPLRLLVASGEQRRRDLSSARPRREARSLAPFARLTRSRACTDAAELEQSEQRAR